MSSDKNFVAKYASFVWGAVSSAFCVISLLLLSGNLQLRDFPAPQSQPSGNFIFDYQTLIAGLFALIGAAWTVQAIFKQIDASRAIEKEKIERKHQALKAALPLFSTPILHYLKQSFGRYKIIQNAIEHREKIPESDRIAFPKDITDFLIEFISYADSSGDEEIGAVISNFLLQIQIHNSRLNEIIVGRIDIQNKIIEDTISTAELFLETERLFEYGRGYNYSYRKLNYSYNQIRSILFFNADFMLDHDDTIRKICESRKGRVDL